MPPIEQMDMHDYAVVWLFVRNDRSGRPLVAEPVELRCRWEEGQFELKDPAGQELVVDVVMATTQDLTFGSILWEGSLDDLEDEVGTTLTPTSRLYEVKTKNRAKDVKGRTTRYEFGLSRFSNRLPDIVEA